MIRLFKQRYALFLAAGAVWAACGVPDRAEAAPLSKADFKALALRCAPSVPVKTLEAIAMTESGLNPWALHDNTTNISATPQTAQAALAEAQTWIGQGDSVDLGLMQINSTNLSSLGATARAALDPCASLASGAAILQAAYAGGNTSAAQQAALLMALSRYNTGSPFKGILNGYARQVISAANASVTPPAKSPTPRRRTAISSQYRPPAWNVWANASYAQTHGASWLIPLISAPRATANSRQSPAHLTASSAAVKTLLATNESPTSPP